MSKQTAVEFLAKSLKDFPHIKHSQSFKDLVNQAKAIEKEQIINALDVGYQIANEDVKFKHIQTTEQYYNETYGGEK
jgi:hypothetical protein